MERQFGWNRYDVAVDENTAYENLSNAVIEQAVADMAEAVLKIELGRRQEEKYNRQFAEVERFFRSKRICDMTTVDPGLLRSVAVQQGLYMIWKHDKGCSKCKLARAKKCVHGKGGVANWYAWSKGDHTCFRQLHDEYKPDFDSLPELDYGEPVQEAK